MFTVIIVNIYGGFKLSGCHGNEIYRSMTKGEIEGNLYTKEGNMDFQGGCLVAEGEYGA